MQLSQKEKRENFIVSLSLCYTQNIHIIFFKNMIVRQGSPSRKQIRLGIGNYVT